MDLKQVKGAQMYRLVTRLLIFSGKGQANSPSHEFVCIQTVIKNTLLLSACVESHSYGDSMRKYEEPVHKCASSTQSSNMM